MRNTTIALVAGLACSAALAGPTGPATEKDKGLRGVAAPGQGAVDGVPAFVENFDSYAAGGGLSGMGGWEPWYGTGADGTIVDSPPGNSPPNSFRYDGFALTDQVNTINFDNLTKYVVSVYAYVPSGQVGEGFFIVNNEYDGVLMCAEWACQVKFDGLFDTVSNDAAGFTTAPTLPLVRDQWVRYAAIVDLTTDVYWDYYGGDRLSDTYLGAPLGWAVNNALGSGGCDPGVQTLAIANIDLFSNGLDMQQMDDVVVACYADMTAVTTGGGAGTLDIFDFLAFQDEFVTNSVIADCDGNQTLDIFDFLCFQDAFVAGCG